MSVQKLVNHGYSSLSLVQKSDKKPSCILSLEKKKQVNAYQSHFYLSKKKMKKAKLRFGTKKTSKCTSQPLLLSKKKMTKSQVAYSFGHEFSLHSGTSFHLPSEGEVTLHAWLQLLSVCEFTLHAWVYSLFVSSISHVGLLSMHEFKRVNALYSHFYLDK